MFFYYFQAHLKQVVNPHLHKRKKKAKSLLNLKVHIEGHYTSCCIYTVQWALRLHMFQKHNKSINFENLALKNPLSSKPETPQQDWHV